MKKYANHIIVGVVLLGVGAAVMYVWQQRQDEKKMATKAPGATSTDHA